MFGGRWGTRASLVQLRLAAAFGRKIVRIKQDAVKTEEVVRGWARIMVASIPVSRASMKFNPAKKQKSRKVKKVGGCRRHTWKSGWIMTGKSRLDPAFRREVDHISLGGHKKAAPILNVPRRVGHSKWQ